MRRWLSRLLKRNRAPDTLALPPGDAAGNRLQAETDAQAIADRIIEHTGKHIRLGLPLGLGKATRIADALTQRALEDDAIQLDIYTALTLVTPRASNDLQKRFLEPARDRLFGGSDDLLYARHLADNTLPDNITVNEFFVMAGQWVHHPTMQQNYIPANYTHALWFLIDKNINVVAQLIGDEDGHYSLSCNPDISADLLALRRENRADFIFAAETHSDLPYMFGDAELSARDIDLLLDNHETETPLFSLPKRPVSIADHAIGLHCARLVEDGGTLQIGIGAIGDAVCHALLLRHEKSKAFSALLSALDRHHNNAPEGDTDPQPFSKGLYGVSEMFVDGLLHLGERGVLTRHVDGAVLHGAFFVDCQQFYQTLRSLPRERRSRYRMVPVSYTNHLYGNEKQKRQARKKARFINSAMMVTLRGAAISDALENGQVISGVGGQYNFVSQAFALPDARSVITVNATRMNKGKLQSNIVWSYGHETIPWHLRDIVVSEYGIADLRGKSESDAIKAMLCIADSRFQDDLLTRAKQAGKLESTWKIPDEYRHNTPQALSETLRSVPTTEDTELLPQFPFGSDFTQTEQNLLPVLNHLKQISHSKTRLARCAFGGILHRDLSAQQKEMLHRLALDDTKGWRERILRWLVTGAIRHEETAKQH